MSQLDCPICGARIATGDETRKNGDFQCSRETMEMQRGEIPRRFREWDEEEDGAVARPVVTLFDEEHS